VSAQENRPGVNTGAVQSVSAGGLKLDTDSTSEKSPDTTAQLSRIETILDSIVGSLAPLAGAR
jgi:hypothetical protein